MRNIMRGYGYRPSSEAEWVAEGISKISNLFSVCSCVPRKGSLPLFIAGSPWSYPFTMDGNIGLGLACMQVFSSPGFLAPFTVVS